MTLEADADGIFRCPTLRCSRYWKATRPLPSELKFPMLRSTDGKLECPGCSYHAHSSNQVYGHYNYHSKRGDKQHPGKVCAATPKNLLSPQEQESLRQHCKLCKQPQPKVSWKERYFCCQSLKLLLVGSDDPGNIAHDRCYRQNFWHPYALEDHSKLHRTTPHLGPAATASYNEEYLLLDIDEIPVAKSMPPICNNNPDQSSNDAAPSSSRIQKAQDPSKPSKDVVPNAIAWAVVHQGPIDSKSISITRVTHADTPLPSCCHCSVLVQGCESGVISINTLYAASCQPPTQRICHPFAGKEGLQLLSHVKRKVGLRFHSDRSTGVESDVYKQFNSRVDEMSKATRGPGGWTRYNQMLDEDLEAARQYVRYIYSKKSA